MQIQKKQVDVIKNEILNKGYERRGKEDYRYSGAITNLYEKVITNTTFKINRKIQILLTFKETDMQPDIYRNVYITIGVFDAADIPEVNEEVVRIEEALYKKLIEVAGDNNVVRGKPDSNSPQPAGFHAPTPLMPPRPTK